MISSHAILFYKNILLQVNTFMCAIDIKYKQPIQIPAVK